MSGPQAAADAMERAAAAYWRLWRANWRPPYPPDDAPAPRADPDRATPAAGS